MKWDTLLNIFIKFNEKNYAANLNLGAVLLKLNRFDESKKYLNWNMSDYPFDVQELKVERVGGAKLSDV